MPAYKNAIIRYKTIDQCLRNKYRRWTLDDLVEVCCEALYDMEGIKKVHPFFKSRFAVFLALAFDLCEFYDEGFHLVRQDFIRAFDCHYDLVDQRNQKKIIGKKLL